MKIAYCWQKSYADNRRGDLEIEVGDEVYLNISPMKEVMRFCKKGKLSPRYEVPYEILLLVGNATYELRLPSELGLVHLVFHVSIHKMCIDDLVSILPFEGLGVDEELS